MPIGLPSLHCSRETGNRFCRLTCRNTKCSTLRTSTLLSPRMQAATTYHVSLHTPTQYCFLFCHLLQSQHLLPYHTTHPKFSKFQVCTFLPHLSAQHDPGCCQDTVGTCTRVRLPSSHCSTRSQALPVVGCAHILSL